MTSGSYGTIHVKGQRYGQHCHTGMQSDYDVLVKAMKETGRNIKIKLGPYREGLTWFPA